MNARNKKAPAFYWFHSLMLVMMAMIFYLSSQNAGESLDVSRGFFSWIVETIGFLLPMNFIFWLKVWIRKVAHFVAFCTLGLCASGTMKNAGCIKTDAPASLCFTGIAGWATATLYAMTDEFHQLFVAGRSGQWSDVLLDSTGALLGTVLFLLGCQIVISVKKIADRQKENS